MNPTCDVDADASDDVSMGIDSREMTAGLAPDGCGCEFDRDCEELEFECKLALLDSGAAPAADFADRLWPSSGDFFA
jgi:hypothetical protein